MENHRFEIDKNHQNLRKSYAGYIKTMENQEKVFEFKIKGKKKMCSFNLGDQITPGAKIWTAVTLDNSK